MKTAFLVLNYNGTKHLERCMAAFGVVTAEGRKHDVWLVDNQSTDGSCDLVSKTFPWVRIFHATENAYLFSYNEIMPKLDTDAVGVFDNDTEVQPGFIEPLLEHLSKEDVFSVGTRILLGDGVTSQCARCSGGYHRGLWWFEQLPDATKPTTTFFAPNQCIYNRRKFLELGGFDRILWPIYHEDIDLAYRAWRRGWRIIYEPSAVIHHYGGQTRTAKGADWHRTVVTKNTFLLQWKNFDDPAMRREHLAWLPPRLARAALKGDAPFLRGFYAAWQQRAAAAAAHRRDQPMRRIGDKEAFERMMVGINGI